MSDDKKRTLSERAAAWMETPEGLAAFKAELDEYAEKARNAPRCFCGDRCDPPFGDGQMCMVCRARPTAECMRIIVR